MRHAIRHVVRVAAAVLIFASVAEGQPYFIRGDYNCDGVVDNSDAQAYQNYLSFGTPLPPCQKASDVNNDGTPLTLQDWIYLNNYLGGGPAPAAPFPDCGTDASAISCAVSCCVPSGSDLFETDPSTFDAHFTAMPLPAGFFGPGSDPFDYAIRFVGVPLETSPTDILGPTDIIVERLEPAQVDLCPSSDDVPIRVRALHLRGFIDVTYGGGTVDSLWQVDVCLSQTNAQETGTMTINRTSPAGGTFTSTLPLWVRFNFTNTIPPSTAFLEAPMQIDMVTAPGEGFWMDRDDVFPPIDDLLIESAGGDVDHDCNAATAMIPFAPTDNFVPGMRAIPGTSCGDVATGSGKTLTSEEAMLAAHGILPAETLQVPDQLGACCLPDGKCVKADSMTCRDVGGTFGGGGTTCAGDGNDDGADDECSLCPCNGDPACDGKIDVVDVVKVVDRAFRGAPAVPDPGLLCTSERTDVGGGPGGSCDGVTNVVDVVLFVDVAFRGVETYLAFCPDTSRRFRYYLTRLGALDITLAKDHIEDRTACHMVMTVRISGAGDIGADIGAFLRRVLSVTFKCEDPCDPATANCVRISGQLAPPRQAVTIEFCDCTGEGNRPVCNLTIHHRGSRIDHLSCPTPASCLAPATEVCQLSRAVSPVDANGNRTIRLFCKCVVP